MKRIIITVMALGALACQHQQRSEFGPSSEERSAYDQGLRLLSRNDFEGAQKHFARVILKYPGSSLLTGALYNEGLAFEGLRDFAHAAEAYKKISELTQGNNSRDTAEALYRLSICYENLNDDSKMIFALLELKNRGSFLSKQTTEVEIPARLAAAYAREGNIDQAEKYYVQAEFELKKWRRISVNNDILVWLPKTLYSMGHSAAIKDDVTVTQFSKYMQALEKTQAWLVQAAELGNNVWSKKAAYEIEDTYDALWKAIDHFRVADQTDRLQALIARQKSQKEMAGQLDSMITKLKSERLPSSSNEPEPAFLTAAFTKLKSIEKKLSLVIDEPDVRDQDTAESKARDGLKGQGQVKEMKGSLK